MARKALVFIMLCFVFFVESVRDPGDGQDPRFESMPDSSYDKSIGVPDIRNFYESTGVPDIRTFYETIYVSNQDKDMGGFVESILLSGSHIIGSRVFNEMGCYPWNNLPALQCGNEVGSGQQGFVTLGSYDENCQSKDSDQRRTIAVKACKTSTDVLRKAARNEIAVMNLFDGIAFVTNLWDSKEEEDAVYILEEGITGGTLESFIQHGHNDVDKALVFHDIAFGLEQMHKKIVVHRDLKPENLLVTSETKRVKIADVAFACTPENVAQIPGIMTCDGLFGTPVYMAPEIFKQYDDNMVAAIDGHVQFRADAFSTKNDMWSLGVILYQLVLDSVTIDDLFDDLFSKQLSQLVQEFDIDAKIEGDTALHAKLKAMKPLAAEKVKLLLQGLLKPDQRIRMGATEAAVITRRWLAALNSEQAYKQTFIDPVSGAPPSCFQRPQDS